jgi:tryptophan synthase alpha chain
MSRISKTIAGLQAQNKKVLIPYLVAGDPQKGLTVDLMHALVRAGAHIIELGIPFSDPSSDGAVIQLGVERALRQGTTLSDVLEMVSEFRRRDKQTPVVLMGYLNPIEIMGYENFASAAAAADVDGVLIVDLPAYECEELFGAVRPRGIDTIFLIAPTTTQERTAGIKDAQSACEMAAISDGVIVGSALVERIGLLPTQGSCSSAQLDEAVAVIFSINEALQNLNN